jgi:hypothetical protein
MICSKCRRPLKNASSTGMGPVCAARFARPVPAHERDLFGYDIDLAVHAAMYRLGVQIDSMAAEAQMEVRKGFHRVRVLLLGWAS